MCEAESGLPYGETKPSVVNFSHTPTSSIFKSVGKMPLIRLAPGLYLRKQGDHAYYLARLQVNGRRADRSLGSAETTTLAEAMIALDKLKRETKAAGQVPRQKKTKAVTLAEVMPTALEAIAEVKRWKTAGSRRQWEQSLADYALPTLGHLHVDEITTDHIHAALRKIWMDIPETASRVRGRLEAVLDWCILKGLRQPPNPAMWRGNLALLLPSKTKVKPVEHHEAPTMTELRKAVAYCLAHPSPVSGALLFATATVARISEVRYARREEVSNGLWTVPRERMKVDSGEAHRVPLSPLAASAIGMGRKRGLIFTADGEPLALDSPRLKLVAIIGRAVTVHGIRSTFRDWAAREGVPDAVAEKCLAHQWGSKVTRAYFRDSLFDQRRDVLCRWASALTDGAGLGALDGKPGHKVDAQHGEGSRRT